MQKLYPGNTQKSRTYEIGFQEYIRTADTGSSNLILPKCAIGKIICNYRRLNSKESLVIKIN